MTGKTISQWLAEPAATLQLRLSKQVLTRALELHRLENGDRASSSRPLLEWHRCKLPKYPVRRGDWELIDDLLKPGSDDPVSNHEGTPL
ncbi:hypothetical protein QO004_003023 [Rhizobium mesoamericanum]|uniref:mobilization protein n=1 Tax=Rhizobium mesoamericanum TaxID=1079800 RepID=UPI00278908CB|nr:mobilization protein [Rhizobium mesoamericanum]MDQ0561230.1 hypothetical protein [Rhizobium mesoamericanum]